jgi:23S rRNA pseudouridine1911/1915/1917 synthase
MARLNREWTISQEGAALATELHRTLSLSHRQAKGLIDGACVKVNGEIVSSHGLRLKVGDAIHVNYDPEQSYEVIPGKQKLKANPFETLYEDKHLLFVNKPAGLLTVPAEQGGEASLAEAVTESYRRRGYKRFTLFIVHRLDRFTSGVLVFGKTPEALNGLKKLFALHKLQRVYRAVLVGELPENSGTLSGHLIEHAKTLKMHVAKERKGPRGTKEMPKGAKEAVTHYRVVERLPGHTIVEVRLETGRRNQIRVQFADRGFPLLGDQVYGTESALIDRQALHAELLGFRHPVTDEQITVQAPAPNDFEAALRALRNHRRLMRAEEGVKGEEGIYKPKITFERKVDRIQRAKRFTTPENARPRSTSEHRSGPRREGSAPFDRDKAPRGPRRNESRDENRLEAKHERGVRAVGRRDDASSRQGRLDSPEGRPPRKDQDRRPSGTHREASGDSRTTPRPHSPSETKRSAPSSGRSPRGESSSRSHREGRPSAPRGGAPAKKRSFDAKGAKSRGPKKR